MSLRAWGLYSISRGKSAVEIPTKRLDDEDERFIEKLRENGFLRAYTKELLRQRDIPID
jgi:hypothetical protein